MWFKNLVVYRLGAGWTGNAEDLEAKLAQQPLQKCGGFQMESRGWTCPHHEGQFVYQQKRQWLLALGFEQKLLPGAVVRQATEERIAEIEARLAHPLGRKQKRDIKEQVLADLMPRALSRRNKTYAWIDAGNRWLVINAVGEPMAEKFIEALKAVEDDLPLGRLETQMSPSSSMSRWILAGEVPGAFGIDDDLELRAPDASKATVRYARHPLDGKDIRDHIAGGKQPVRLGLTWNDRISFVLTEQLHIKRLSFTEILEREAGEEVENEDERFELDFALMTGELSRMLADLVKVLGGEKGAEGRKPEQALEESLA